MNRAPQRDKPWREFPVELAVGTSEVRTRCGSVAPIGSEASRARVTEVFYGEGAEERREFSGFENSYNDTLSCHPLNTGHKVACGPGWKKGKPRAELFVRLDRKPGRGNDAAARDQRLQYHYILQ